jgi:cell filamentation protein
MSDPYIDPQSGILRNKFGLTNQESLNRAEANAVSASSILLQLNPLRGSRSRGAQCAAHTRSTSTCVPIFVVTTAL